MDSFSAINLLSSGGGRGQVRKRTLKKNKVLLPFEGKKKKKKEVIKVK